MIAHPLVLLLYVLAVVRGGDDARHRAAPEAVLAPRMVLADSGASARATARATAVAAVGADARRPVEVAAGARSPLTAVRPSDSLVIAGEVACGVHRIRALRPRSEVHHTLIVVAPRHDAVPMPTVNPCPAPTATALPVPGSPAAAGAKVRVWRGVPAGTPPRDSVPR